jgi:N-acetylglucosaminyldiphosphoundecaprenol N-acetyl-beta-D-mannosaminyltransferase
MREKVKILGVNFDRITTKDTLEKISDWLEPGFHFKKKHIIVTPNPEFLLEAQKDKKFRRILNKADLSIPDGIGILWASKFKQITTPSDSKIKKFSKWVVSLGMIPLSKNYTKTVLPERVTGTDLMQKICKLAAEKKSKVFLLGAGKGVAEKAAEKLIKKYPKLQIVGTYAGTPKHRHDNKILRKINEAKPEILFVAYGAPAQEKWINRNYKLIPTLKLAMGIGGAFDFIAGIRRRAPASMRKAGLEWLYRLCKQPSRIKRIAKATIVFPIKIFTSSSSHPSSHPKSGANKE